MSNKRHSITDREYREQIEKLQQLNAADSPERPDGFHDVSDLKEEYL